MSVSKLKEYAKSVNLVDSLDKETVDQIAIQVMNGYTEDLNSMSEWLADIKKIEELVDLKSTKKTVPLPNSANIKLPMITKACYEYVAKVIPEIIKDDAIIKIRPIGVMPSEAIKLAATRAETFLNWQMLLRNTEWSDQLNMLMFRLAVVGFMCTKTYYDPVRRQITSDLCQPDELILNTKTKSLAEAARISHKQTWRLNSLIEKANRKVKDVSIFCKESVDDLKDLHKDDLLDQSIEGIEQCTYLDLDEDGYKEPYVITITAEPVKVLRIVALYSSEGIITDGNDEVCYIEKEEYYEDFHFLMNPKGYFQSVGFGILLLHMTEAANSTYNQLADASQLANLKGGYMDARFNPVKKGQTRHIPGEFQLVRTETGMPLKDGIMPFDFGEPSSVMLQLLQMLIDLCRDLTSSAEINNGTQSSENAKTGATLALQEEGRKATTLINKGVYRSLSKVFKHRFILNSKYLTDKEYRNILNDDLASVTVDFNITNFDVIPMADPNLASSQQRIQDLTVLQGLLSLPGINPIKVVEQIIQRINIPGIKDVLLNEKDQQQAPPNPEMLKLQHEMESDAASKQLEGQKLDLQKQDLAIKAQLAQAQLKQIEANSIALLAKAGSEEQKTNLSKIQAELAIIGKQMDTELSMAQIMHEKDQQQNDHMQQAQSQIADQQHQQSMAQLALDNQPPTGTDGGSA